MSGCEECKGGGSVPSLFSIIVACTGLGGGTGECSVIFAESSTEGKCSFSHSFLQRISAHVVTWNEISDLFNSDNIYWTFITWKSTYFSHYYRMLFLFHVTLGIRVTEEVSFCSRRSSNNRGIIATSVHYEPEARDTADLWQTPHSSWGGRRRGSGWTPPIQRSTWMLSINIYHGNCRLSYCT